MEISASLIRELTRRAREAAEHAYTPYSNFPVGAAVLAQGGQIYAGANVENASYGLSICAERAAIFQAVAQGTRQIEAIVIYTPTPVATTPCGPCRQVIHDVGTGALVVCCTHDEQARRPDALAELLPIAAARSAVAELGLPNVALFEGDLSALPETLGDFDYMIAHGVYSWVPAPVRDAMFELAQRRLKRSGILFVSYNVYPGCHVRQAV